MNDPHDEDGDETDNKEPFEHPGAVGVHTLTLFFQYLDSLLVARLRHKANFSI